MTDPLEEIEFLARSPNRIRVLETLSSGPHTRGELQAAVGASQPTLARILGDFEEREWVKSQDGTYETTRLGSFVASGFRSLLSVMETESRLREVAGLLPADRFDFGLERLSDAEITTPTRADPGGPLNRALELARGAETHRIVSYVLNHEMLETVDEATAAEDQSFECVVTAETVDLLGSEYDAWRRLRSLAGAEAASVWVTDREIPFAVGVADDTVYLFLRDESGLLRALVESEDPAVRSWALGAVERYRTASEELDRSALGEPP
ncbi:ArsR family transcriptional regulator [Natronomonas sp. F2-12]|jgi:predicted transcriptional regulator|uniref:ArsR family transcriptional regulator n=1 Tax=Natronomonas aquatica TaxID=2841590 RepID=A0A9R1CTU4_9EURY|nr:ArsR family transcriptional regulator [Natronomonas aquatica]MCQ4333885.1 ArsR family transcriptional regulator [Natronomonas aquatica]